MPLSLFQVVVERLQQGFPLVEMGVVCRSVLVEGLAGFAVENGFSLGRDESEAILEGVEGEVGRAGIQQVFAENVF